MLTEIGDWYRIIAPMPNDERLGQRKLAASSLADAWEGADASMLLAIVSLVIEIAQTSHDIANPALASVADAVVESQPSFDRKAEVASLDLRICAAVALSEVIHRANSTTGLRSTGIKGAACLVSGLRFRHWSCPRAVSDQLQKMLSSAEEVLRLADNRRRKRIKEPLFDLSEVAADFSKAKEEYEIAFSILMEELLKDREELQALWWVFGGYSILKSEKYADIRVGAALLAGLELSTILSSPPTIGMSALASRMIRSAHGTNKTIILRKLFDELPADLIRICAPKAGKADLVRQNTEVFPVSSCLLRASESDLDATHVLKETKNWRSQLSIGSEELAEQFYFESGLSELLKGT